MRERLASREDRRAVAGAQVRPGATSETALRALLVALLTIAAGPACAQAIAPERLVAAYPDALERIDGGELVWRDGTRMPLSAGQPPAPRLHDASILDMLSEAYPPGPPEAPPAMGQDPGRTRNHAFFAKMYGECRRGEVDRHLVPLVWLPHAWGRTVRATDVNGVADKLAAISRELDDLPDALRRFAYPLGGIYSCRPVADTGEPSMHAEGAAIDINVAASDYWLWRRGAPYRNRIPWEIVRVFEGHGFIWGGKWAHYDTMHFEYRPELLQ